MTVLWGDMLETRNFIGDSLINEINKQSRIALNLYLTTADHICLTEADRDILRMDSETHLDMLRHIT